MATPHAVRQRADQGGDIGEAKSLAGYRTAANAAGRECAQGMEARLPGRAGSIWFS